MGIKLHSAVLGTEAAVRKFRPRAPGRVRRFPTLQWVCCTIMLMWGLIIWSSIDIIYFMAPRCSQKQKCPLLVKYTELLRKDVLTIKFKKLNLMSPKILCFPQSNMNEWLPWWLRGKDPSPVQELHGPQVWSLGRADLLEEGMATHSSILAWRIPWTGKPGGLPSTGPQRAGHDWSDLALTQHSMDM